MWTCTMYLFIYLCRAYQPSIADGMIELSNLILSNIIMPSSLDLCILSFYILLAGNSLKENGTKLLVSAVKNLDSLKSLNICNKKPNYVKHIIKLAVKVAKQ